VEYGFYKGNASTCVIKFSKGVIILVAALVALLELFFKTIILLTKFSIHANRYGLMV